MKKVLFTGATGLLGKYFFDSSHKDFELFGTFNRNSNLKKKNFYPLDVSNRDEVFDLVRKIKPNYIVHAAAIGNVDYCETHKNEAENINVGGTRNIVDASSEFGSFVIFTSSNAIFDGKKPPYVEDSKIHPLDYYGYTKEKGEEIIKKSGVQYSIIRLMTMYGWAPKGGRNNPVGWVIEELKKKNTINVVNDVYNNHLYVGQAVDVIWEIIKKNKINETYNVGGAESINRYDLAIMTAKVFGLDTSLINSVTSDFFKNIVPRPKDTTFVTLKIEKQLNIKPLKIIEGLKKMSDEK